MRTSTSDASESPWLNSIWINRVQQRGAREGAKQGAEAVLARTGTQLGSDEAFTTSKRDVNMPEIQWAGPQAENRGGLKTPRGLKMPGQLSLSRCCATRLHSRRGSRATMITRCISLPRKGVLRTNRDLATGPGTFVHKALSKRGCCDSSVLPTQHLAAMQGPGSGISLPPELCHRGPHAARLRM